jgi:hypothetical protein
MPRFKKDYIGINMSSRIETVSFIDSIAIY